MLGLRLYYVSPWRVVVILYLCLSAVSASAESIMRQKETNEKNLHCLNFGFGGCSAGVALGASYSHQLKIGVLTTRIIYGEQVSIWNEVDPPERVWEIGVLYGWFTRGRLALFGISGGVGLIGGIRHGDFLYHTGFIFGTSHFEDIPYTTVGIPIEVQMFLSPFKFMGFGLTTFANFNSEKLLRGTLLSLQFRI